MPAEHIIQAFQLSLPEGPELPEHIQWMPPGKHKISASKNGKPAQLEVEVNEEVAKSVRASFLNLKEKGKRPYLDFNHNGAESSATVVDIFWGGEDPKLGGVRARVEWTKPGEEALRGRAYNFFSPTFLISEKTGAVTGTTTNMGGLVNEPAFSAISPLMGKNQPKETTTMTKLLEALVSAKLLPKVDLSEDEAVAAFSAAIKARADEATALQTRVEAAETQVKAAKTQHATSLVEAAVKDGRIPPKDEDTKAFFVNAIVTAGSSAEKALAALTPNPVFAKEAIVAVKAKENQTGEDEPSQIMAKQAEAIATYLRAHPEASRTQAFSACSAENPALFSK